MRTARSPLRRSASASAFAAVVLATAMNACGDATSEPEANPMPSPPPVPCEADQRAAADGTCELFASAPGCGSGTRPAIGSDACVPVGSTSCAAGFERDATGWGCAEILPRAICTGATRPRLGDRACSPVGDCTSAYPPSGAIIVDPALADGAIDATHVRTVSDAIASAADGATIALADGTHTADPFTLSKAVSLVGRCAARARLVPAQAGGTFGIAIRANVKLSGVTLDGYTEALSISGAVEVSAENIVIERARSRGLFAQRAAKVRLRGSVVRGTSPIGTSDQTVAVFADSSAQVAVEDSAILASTDAAIAGTGSVSTRVTVVRSVVQDTKPRPDGIGGGALRAFEGAHLDVTESAILGSTGTAVLTFRRNAPPPEVTLTRSVVRGTVATEETGRAIGTAINAAFEAVVRIDESTIADSEGTALFAAEKAKIAFRKSVVVGARRTRDLSAHGGSSLKGALITVEDSAIVGIGAVGLGAWDRGRVTLQRSLVRDVGGDIVEGLPMGQGLYANLAASIEAVDSAIVDARELGASASKTGTTIRLEKVLITRSDGAAASTFGHGVLAVDSAGVTLSRSIIERQAGVALFFAAAGGSASASTIRGNAVGAHVQDGSTIAEVETVPEVVAEQELVVTKDTRFAENATRIGSGVLPLPAPLAPP